MRRKLSEFFADRSRDDLLLLHVSCHGLKDEDGTLYFANANTAVEHLEATAIPSEFVNRQMTKSRSRRIVLLLDCCFGGAFARGLVHRAGESVAIKEEFEGQGRVVLTASRAMEYAFEGDTLEGEAQPSIFTSAIVEGLESGRGRPRRRQPRLGRRALRLRVRPRARDDAEPDARASGRSTCTATSTSRAARSGARPVALPVELRAAMESPFAHVRAGAVEELADLLGGSDAGLAAAAQLALGRLADDDSRRVSDAAARALGLEASASPVERAPPETPSEAASTDAGPAALHRRGVAPGHRSSCGAPAGHARAGGGAAARSCSGTFGPRAGSRPGRSQPTSTGTSGRSGRRWRRSASHSSSPARSSRTTRRTRRSREGVDGLLLAVGILVCFVMVAFAGSTLEVRATGTVVITALGAVAIAASGALGILSRRAREAALPQRVVGIAGAGAVLALAPLVDESRRLGHVITHRRDQQRLRTAQLPRGTRGRPARTPRDARPRGHSPRAPALRRSACRDRETVVTLHLTGIVVHISYFESVGAVRWGGPLGIIGGLLLVAAGAMVVRAAETVESPAAVGMPVT